MHTKKKLCYDILSPDGFSIRGDGGYSTLDELESDFILWKNQYTKQGYYSSNNGPISLDSLRDYCLIINL